MLAAIRRYVSGEHGEIDTRAYLNEASRRSEGSGPTLSWDPLAVYGTRSPETNQAEVQLYGARNEYFARLAEEFLHSRAQGALEWTRTAFATGRDTSVTSQDFVDETRSVPVSLLQGSRVEEPSADPEEVEWLAELELSLPEEAPQEPRGWWRKWLRRWRDFWEALQRRLGTGR